VAVRQVKEGCVGEGTREGEDEEEREIDGQEDEEAHG
jgi:hypothetical protein